VLIDLSRVKPSRVPARKKERKKKREKKKRRLPKIEKVGKKDLGTMETIRARQAAATLGASI
jgi:hypothetical protein